MVAEIENHLRCQPGVETVVADFGKQLRDRKHTKFQAYSMVWAGDLLGLQCRPWYGSDVMWGVDWSRMSAGDVRKLWGRIVA